MLKFEKSEKTKKFSFFEIFILFCIFFFFQKILLLILMLKINQHFLCVLYFLSCHLFFVSVFGDYRKS